MLTMPGLREECTGGSQRLLAVLRYGPRMTPSVRDMRRVVAVTLVLMLSLVGVPAVAATDPAPAPVAQAKAVPAL